MPSFDHVVTSDVKETKRTMKLRALFDVPPREKVACQWGVDIPIEDREWNIGLIVGPSGCGKTQIMTRAFGPPLSLEWSSNAVIDDFPSSLAVQDIADICNAVGFNTVPSWLKPFAVLSNGERFRVELARALCEPGLVVMDEFTSVVDRQVGKIASHAVQRHVRRSGRQIVVASCHYDIIDWLQPDWIYEPALEKHRWRSLQRRPGINLSIRRVPREVWGVFHRHHYMSARLNPTTQCFCAFVSGEPVAFFGLVHRPVSRGRSRDGRPVYGVSRVVTLPDWQGLGIIMALIDTVSSAYKSARGRVRGNVSHWAMSHALAKSPNWRLVQKPRTRKPPRLFTENRRDAIGMRPSAVFEYVGPAMGIVEAELLLARSAS